MKPDKPKPRIWHPFKARAREHGRCAACQAHPLVGQVVAVSFLPTPLLLCLDCLTEHFHWEDPAATSTPPPDTSANRNGHEAATIATPDHSARTAPDTLPQFPSSEETQEPVPGP